MEDALTHVSQALVLTEDELTKSKDLILNISIEDLMDDIEAMTPTFYIEVLDFLKKVLIFYLK